MFILPKDILVYILAKCIDKLYNLGNSEHVNLEYFIELILAITLQHYNI